MKKPHYLTLFFVCAFIAGCKLTNQSPKIIESKIQSTHYAVKPAFFMFKVWRYQTQGLDFRTNAT